MICLMFLAACQAIQRTGIPVDLTQTALPFPAISATTLPSPTFTMSTVSLTPSPALTATATLQPSPTFTPSQVPQTQSTLPNERVAFSVIINPGAGLGQDDSTIAFANGDGSGLEFPKLFEPFRHKLVTGRHLAWSPDGLYLAFDGVTEIYECGIPNSDCYTTNYGTFLLEYSQGSILEHIEGSLTNSSWAPDSRRLVLSIDEGQISGGDASLVGDLYILDVQSGQMTRLTDHSFSDLYPAWSPDGQWIAFVRFNPDLPGCSPLPVTLYEEDKSCSQASLYLIHPDGSDLRLLLEPIHIEAPVGGRDDGPYNAPAWSPDSQWLAILVGDETYPIPLFQDIVLVDALTGEARFLTKNGAIRDIYPAWSPDGRLAFVSNREGNEEIYIMNADGTEVKNLTQNPGDNYAPAWSPSGQRIAFLSNSGMEFNHYFKLYIMNADGTNPVLIDNQYELASGRPAWFPAGQP